MHLLLLHFRGMLLLHVARIVLLGVLIGVVFPTSAARSARLVALTNAELIYDVDPETGELSNPRSLGVESPVPFAGLAYSGQYGLFTVSNNPADGKSLFRIDPIDGTAVQIGPTGDDRTKGSLEFDPETGLLYVAGLVPLSTIDIATGEQSEVGAIDLSGFSASAMTWDPSGSLLILDGTGRRLVNVDPASASVLRAIETYATNEAGIGRIEYASTLGGMDFDPLTGELFAATTTSLYRIDPVSGVGRRIGADVLGSDDRFVGLAFIPEPTTVLLLALGLAVLSHRGVRRLVAPGSG